VIDKLGLPVTDLGPNDFEVKEGKTVRASVCVQCIRSGKVQRPTKRKPFSTPQV